MYSRNRMAYQDMIKYFESVSSLLSFCFFWKGLGLSVLSSSLARFPKASDRWISCLGAPNPLVAPPYSQLVGAKLLGNFWGRGPSKNSACSLSGMASWWFGNFIGIFPSFDSSSIIRVLMILIFHKSGPKWSKQMTNQQTLHVSIPFFGGYESIVTPPLFSHHSSNSCMISASVFIFIARNRYIEFPSMAY